MASKDVEDDEAWLYGDNPKEGEAESSQSTGDGKATEETPVEDVTMTTDASGIEVTIKVEDKEEGEMSGEDGDKTEAAPDAETPVVTAVDAATNEDDDDDDDDDSDDDVQVTIGEIKPQSYDTPKFKTGYQRPGAQASTSATKTSGKGVDLDQEGTVNGTPIYEFDLDTLQADDKPWRKPGADITDYFNYGFTEETWMKYCERQKRLRYENNPGGKTLFISHGNNTTITPSKTTEKTIPTTGTTEDPFAAGRKAGPPPGRKMSGTIDVIGSSTRDSRRPTTDFFEQQQAEVEQQATQELKYEQFTTPPPNPGLGPPPPMSGAPPNLSVPPPNFSMPPPGMPPPNMPPGPPPPHMGPPPPHGPPGPGMGGPPPGFPGPPPDNRFDGFFPGPGGPPPRGPPPPGFGERPPFFDPQFGPGPGPPPGYGGPPPPGGPDFRGGPPDAFSRPPWEYNPRGSDSDFSSEDEERNYRRGGDSRRGEHRPRRSDRSRSRDRDRGREHERERDRRHRDREKERDSHRDSHRDSRDSRESSRGESSRGEGRETRDREGRETRDREGRETRDREGRDRDRERERDREERRKRSSSRKHEDDSRSRPKRSKHSRRSKDREEKEDSKEGILP